MHPLPDTLDGPQWLDLLERLAARLGNEGPPLRLCLIGSSACLFGGMETRTSRDLDVWQPMSDYDRLELRQAAESVGLLYQPRVVVEPDRPYLQIVEEGVVEVGAFEPVLIERIGRLQLMRPPIENIIASKLVRGDARDVNDIFFLQLRYRPDPRRIQAIIEGFSPRNRQRAEENIIYLQLINP